MGCLIAILAMFMPRVVLLAAWLFADWSTRAFEGRFWPVMGFIFAPFTTLAYMGAQLNMRAGEWSTGWTVIVVLAVMADLASDSGASNSARATR